MSGMTDNDLDVLFAEAAEAPEPSVGLMARVLADAEAERRLRVQAAPMAPVPVSAVAPSSGGFWSGLAAVFGGGGALAGMASAAVAGLYLGFVQPDALTSLTGVAGTLTASLTGGASIGDTNVDTMDLMPGIDALLAEE